MRHTPLIGYRKWFFTQFALGAFGVLFLLFSGCSGGSSDGFQEGRFVDSPVEGLTYECGGLSGVTDEAGTFRYIEGEAISFSAGGIQLGEPVDPQEIMTPMDLFSSASSFTDPWVTNVLMFLQTLDEDGDAENGITITSKIREALADKTISFEQNTGSFTAQAQVLADSVFDDGRLMVTGDNARSHMQETLMAMVETRRDDKGVWFISEKETPAPVYSIFEAMGYNVASDRLWQAELYRRTAHGTLAELFGTEYLEQDIFMRTIGYSDAELESGFNGLGKEQRMILSAYADGFNRRIDEIKSDPSQLPFEFASLGITPEKWTYKDILAWISTLPRQFDCEALSTGQLDNLALLNTLKAKYPDQFMGMLYDLRWINDPEALTYIPSNVPSAAVSASSEKEKTLNRKVRADNGVVVHVPDVREAAFRLNSLFDKMDTNLEKINAKVKMGSYAWVVSGDMTDSGNPTIYSGPQMGFSVPSIVLEGSIESEDLNISGMTVAGIPGIIIGRTPNHAWSMQVGHAHTVDYYIESAEAVDPQPRMETVKVAGADDVTIPVWKTEHGPVVSPMPYDPSTYDYASDGPIISWRYANKSHEFTSVKSIMELARAESMDDFQSGVESLAVSQHFCYADTDGNIAYFMSGIDPIRPETGEYRLPQGALGPALEWDESILKPISTDRNTAQGFYCGWNNKSSDDYANSYNRFSYNFGPFNRAQVIHDYLASASSLSFEEIRDLALNIAVTDTSFNSRGGDTWKFVESHFTEAVTNNSSSERLDALALFDSYDGRFVKGGEENWVDGTDRADAWMLLDLWIDNVLEMTFRDELGADMFSTQNTNVLFNVLIHGLNGEQSGIVNRYDWFSNSNAEQPGTPEEIIVAALDDALDALGSRPWGENARDEIEFTHDMIGKVHSIPYASRSTYAHCVEMGPDGPVRIESMFPLGESGNILLDGTGQPRFDPHFYSMKNVYDDFSHREFPVF